jgi:hypothetical protein
MREIRMLALAAAGALVIALPMATLAQERREMSQPARADKPPQAPVTMATAPVYKPPLRGAPGGRVGGGTRGGGGSTQATERAVFFLSVLAPDHTGLTISEQPSLYWFISSRAPSPVEVTLVDPRATKPVLAFRLTSPVEAGVHRIRLADHQVRLEPGVAYRWYVAVVPDADRRTKDFLTGGAIERIELPEGLRARLEEADRMEMPSLYAEAGLWYDAITVLSELIDNTPGHPTLSRQRAAMLNQVGLPGIGE